MSPIRQLQRRVGNQALQRMLQAHAGRAKEEAAARDAPLKIQPKLTVNTPGDVHEQEADRVAGQVMRMPEPSAQSNAQAVISGHAMTPAVRVQTKSTHPGDSGGASAPPIVHEVLRSPGQPLDAATRAFMEPRFGQDFGQVRVHTDAKAAESARTIGAQAYTVGENLVFGAGRYAPGSMTGKQLLAHELTHTVQQQGHAQTTIQRKSGGNVLAVDGGPIAHADGNYAASTGILTTPSGPAGYAETRKTDPGNLYDTYFSIARRFGLSTGDVRSANSGIADRKIQHGMAIAIPDIAPRQSVPAAAKIATAAPTAAPTVGGATAPSAHVTTTTAAVAGTTPAATTSKIKTTYDLQDIRDAAWDLLQGEKSVMEAFLFYTRFDKLDPSIQQRELKNIFNQAGSYSPDLSFPPTLATTGNTPEPDDEKTDKAMHKPMFLNRLSSFPLAVSTYLHEMVHYADIWYSSEAAAIEDKYRKGKERTRGMRKGALTKDEQVSALSESVQATIEKILLDMQQSTPQPDEHPSQAPKKRKEYQLASSRVGFNRDAFIEKVKTDLRAEGANLYADWKAKIDPAGEITAKRIELGFAFEKTAYGFYSPGQKKGEWAVDFIKKFENKYGKYLQ
jgi:hypothetical protein